MALSKSSVLHYWSSRYGINPRVGGRPVFTRNSAGLFTTQEGEVDTAIVNTPRFDWATLNLPNSLTERRKVLTLELASTNSLVAPSDFSNGVWTGVTITVATGKPDPMGGNTACTLTATGATSYRHQILSAGTSIIRTNSLWMRRRTGSGIVQLNRPDVAGGVNVSLSPDWKQFFSPGPASTSRTHETVIMTSGDAIDVWLAQMDDEPFGTSGIVAGSGATRATDTLYWNFPPVPQGFYLYVRFVEQGSVQLLSSRIVAISDVAENNPRFIVYSPAANAGYSVFFNNGTSFVTSPLSTIPAMGDTVELVAQLQPSGVVQLYQSINGAPIAVSTGSGALALPGAWGTGAPALQLNSGGSSKFAEVKIVKFADVVSVTNQTIFNEVQAFELGPNADVL